MRVITGTARGRKLNAPAGLETRPTTELVKEAVFSTIQFEIEGAVVLDLFAGSGQMGLEALSRGAKLCTFVDNAKQSQSVIRDNLERTGLSQNSRIVAMEASAFLKNASGSIDIAFVDPPYQKGLIKKLLDPLAAVMRSSGIIICETDRSEIMPETAGSFKKHKAYRYGKTMITVYRGSTEE